LKLNLEINNVTEWKAILNTISDLTEEAMFLCNDDGITFRGMDKAHIAYLSATFPKSSFNVYECETAFFILPIKEFKNLFNTADNMPPEDLEDWLRFGDRYSTVAQERKY